MEATELFYPDINAEIGDYSFAKGIEINASSSKDSYFDWAKIRFTKQFKDEITIQAGDKAIIQLGYNGVFDDVFEGYVNKPYNNGGGLNEILLKDDMIWLENTLVNNTFLEVTPQEIIRFCLKEAGIANAVIDSSLYPEKLRVPISQKNAVSVINEVNSLWGLSNRFFFSSGIFYWGAAPAQGKIYEFEYGTNIIALNRIGSVWELETVSAPFIKHSQLISVSHPQIAGEFEVIKVVFTTSETGFIRTYIYF